jgi:hypothetical protein
VLACGVVLQDDSRSKISKVVQEPVALQTSTICSEVFGTLLFDNLGKVVLQLSPARGS